MKENIFKKVAVISLTTALFGQVYINPFNTDFRISIGIVVLALLLIKFEKTPILMTTIITGITVVLFRILIGYISGQEIAFSLQIYMPSFFFYLTYGIMLKVFRIRESVKQPILMIAFLSFSDVISNLIEAMIRYEFINLSAKIVVSSLFIAGFLRAVIILGLNLGLVFYNLIILKDENNLRIKEFLLMASKMKTESIFLRKSMNDIEKAMNKSYYLYNHLNQLKEENVTHENIEDFKEEILELTKDIHEVKKDNERVIAGIEKIIPYDIQFNELSLNEIISMLKENTESLAKMAKKEIKITTAIINKNLKIKDYYPLITILINLLSNAVDAITEIGIIDIKQIEDKEWMILQVSDSGKGIKSSDTDIVFRSGYSTKYDLRTGKMSSGIGLTHVRALVEEYYGGSIDLLIRENEWTKFEIKILKSNL